MAGRQSNSGDDDDLRSPDRNRRTFAHEGAGEEIDPAVEDEEWTDASNDQIEDLVDLDDPVEALESSVLWAATEGSASGDSTELADAAVPEAPEQAAFLGRTHIDPESDELTVGLPAGTEINTEDTDDLLEAELTAIDEGDPETAAILADEIQRRQKEG